MTWKIEWHHDGRGKAEHEPTGARFYAYRSGWISIDEAAGLSDQLLQRLMEELREELKRDQPLEAPPSKRIH
jgi:hypothetical protein